MESPSAKSNSVAMSNSSSKNDEEENHASNPELNSSSSVVAIPPIVPEAQEPLEHLHVANANEVHDYRCKYCDKRFSNKQALGGHQNAHKTERAMEKNAHELRQRQFAYLGGASYPVMVSHPNFPGPFNYRAMINRPYLWQQPVHHGVHIGHYARPLLPVVAHPYAPRALYPGWDVHMPGVPQYMEPSLHVQYNPQYMEPPLHVQYNPQYMGYSSARPVSEAHPNFANSGLVPGRDPGNQNNNQMNNPQNQEDEDSDLDLTLRL